MSTRARIGLRYADGRVKSIFLHFDGGPGKMLPRLNDEYGEARAVELLLADGDLKSMGCPAVAQPAAKLSRTVADYLRHARDCWAEHVYLFDGGCWWHRSLLTEVMR